MPVPVRAVWAAASPEEQRRAHDTATVILRTWLGKATREEGAKELSLSPLRFWQLSQQAVAGLVAGLVTQPRFRGRAAGPSAPPEESVGVLKKRIAALERELEGSRRLIGILKDLPTPRAALAPPSPESGDGRARKRGRRSVADVGGGARGAVEEARDERA